MADEATAETRGMFVCSCLWTGTLSFSPEEVKGLDGEIKRYMGPCPECSRNSLTLTDDTPSGTPPWERDVDSAMDEMEKIAGADTVIARDGKVPDLFADEDDEETPDGE